VHSTIEGKYVWALPKSAIVAHTFSGAALIVPLRDTSIAGGMRAA
jgi:hypothetical protein